MACVAVALAWTPPAQAAGATTAVVTGTLTLNGPVQAPCTGTAPCPPPIIPSPPPFIGKLGPLFSVEGGALRMGSFTQATCAPAPCSVVFSLAYRGYCGLATGRGSGGLLDANGEAHLLDLTFTAVGTELVVRGNARRYSTGEVGDLFGAFTVVLPAVECAMGTATTLPLAGDLTVTYPKVTP
jgi:hypothetical protein